MTMLRRPPQRMIILKSPDEIEVMRRANVIVAEILENLRTLIRPGVTTMDLEHRAEELLKKQRAKGAFKGYHGYPCNLCTSVNHEVVHGIPSSTKVLCEGDIVSIDCGVIYDGFVGDSAITAAVGSVSEEASNLVQVTRDSLFKGIEQACANRRLFDIGAAVQRHVESRGYSVVREFVGHGIGRNMHEPPQVPNFGRPGRGELLKAGMVLAIEPMVNAGGYEVEKLADGWTVVTKDQSLSAHWEHSVAITPNGPYILSQL